MVEQLDPLWVQIKGGQIVYSMENLETKLFQGEEGVIMLNSMEAYMTCDFPGVSVRTGVSPLLKYETINESFLLST